MEGSRLMQEHSLDGKCDCRKLGFSHSSELLISLNLYCHIISIKKVNPWSIMKSKFTPCNRVGFLRQDLKTHFPYDAKYTNSKLSVLNTPKNNQKIFPCFIRWRMGSRSSGLNFGRFEIPPHIFPCSTDKKTLLFLNWFCLFRLP